jgi:hypothetical protein
MITMTEYTIGMVCIYVVYLLVAALIHIISCGYISMDWAQIITIAIGTTWYIRNVL